jgi:hypothetical protein
MSSAALIEARLRWTIAWGAVLACAGCGGGPVPVSGVVTLDGQPLPQATVTFLPLGQGRTASGFTDAEGRFHLSTLEQRDGALPGEYKVTVTVAAAVSPFRDDPRSALDRVLAEQNQGDPADAAPAAGGAIVDEAGAMSAVPARYGKAQETPLTVKVPTDGEVTLELTSETR